MARVPTEPTELDPADLVDDEDEATEAKTSKRDSKSKAQRARMVAHKVSPIAQDVKISAPPPAPRKAAPPADFPDVESLVRDARKRADAAGQLDDRVALARARTELAVLLEVVKKDLSAALAEYRAAHAIAPSALAPIAATRRLTPFRPVAPALALLEAELRATSDGAARAARLVELGRLLLAGGAAPEKAVQAFREALATHPRDPGALRGLERALRTLPRASDSAAALDALASHLETMAVAFREESRLAAWLGVERAILLEKLRRPEAARAALVGALEIEPGLGPVRDAYTRHLVVHDEVKALVDAWRGEASLEGDSARAGRMLYAAARLASERLDDSPLAIELYRRLTALENTPLATRRAAFAELARLYAQTGDSAAAAQAEKELLPWVDDMERAYRHRRLARSFEELGRPAETAEQAQAALAMAPDDDETRERLDRALAELRRHEQRLSMWTAEASRVSALSTRTAALRRAALVADRDMVRPDLALVALRAAWTIDPDDVEIGDAICRMLTPTSPPNPDDPADPARARARIDFYAEAAAKTDDRARKVAYLEKLAQIWEDEVQAPARALDIYVDILGLEPERRSAVLGLQRNAARAGDARELFRALVLEADQANNPTIERSLLLRAAEIASGELSDADTALDLVKRVLAKNAGDPLALRAAYRVHQRTGRHDEALAQLRLLLSHTRKGPGAVTLAVEIASILEQRLRRRDEALAAYREARKIDPTHPLPPAEIRRILVEVGDFRALAEELASMASTGTPEARSRWLLEAGEIYADRLDEIERATALFAQARALAPEDPTIAERLERAYLRQGKTGDLVLLLEAKPEKTQSDQLLLALLLADDRDKDRGARVLAELLAAEPKHVPAQRALEHTLAKTDRFGELGSVLRLQAATFDTTSAKTSSLYELVAIEEYRGIAPPPNAASAVELLALVAPHDPVVHGAVVRGGAHAVADGAVARITSSLGALAAGSADSHQAATFELMAALLLETSPAPDPPTRADALRRYRFVLDGWPECLTAARGLRRLAERLGDNEALIESSAVLGNLEIDPTVRAERLAEAAEGALARDANVLRAQSLFTRALGEDPDSTRAARGVIAIAFDGPDPGMAADALRRALDRTRQSDQAVRLGNALAKLAFERLGDPTVGIEALRRVRKRAPGNVSNLLNLAEANARMKLWADAADIAASAIGITRDSTERARAAVLVAESHAEIPDNVANAKRDANAAEKLCESVPGEARSELLTRVGAVYQLIGDRAAAERVLRDAVLRGGAAKKPLELLAQSHGASTYDGAVAFARALGEIVERARSLQIQVDPSWIATLGKLEAMRLSKPRDGIAKLKEAIFLDPQRLDTYEALTDVYTALGAHDDSVNELLATLPEVAARGVGPEKMAALVSLLARECKLARRHPQANIAESIVAYLETTQAAAPSAGAGPAANSLAGSTLSALLTADKVAPWLEVSAVLLESAPKILRVDPYALGLAPRDRLPPKAPHPTRALADRIARAFGEPRFDLFVDAAAVGVPRIVPSEPPAIVLPRGYGDLADNEQAAGICRLVVYVTVNVPWLDDLGPSDLEGLLLGAMRAGDEGWQRGRLAANAEANAELWRPRVARAIGRKQKRSLEEIAARTKKYVDAEGFRDAVRRTSLRAAYLVTGDLASTLNHFVRTERDLAQVARTEVTARLLAHPLSRDLIFYALSPECVALRRQVKGA